MLGRLLSDVLRQLTAEKRTSPRPEAQLPGENPLAEYFFNNPGRLIHKWHHYFEIYHRHFARFRGRSPVVVEIGVFHGGSLQMWHHYFGPGTRVVGIDIDPRCRSFEDEATTILIGDQGDRRFLAEVRGRVPHIDMLIDRLYGWYSRDHTVLTADEFTRATYALHFYDSVLVIEKSPKAPPQTSLTGTPSF